ncbi:MAG: peptide chain release factor N(5)-glutamine methyltransferase [Clostridiales Family XIII bacterium]|jgi:release factor glutamine methyltransferase|nr:peptide chain release factor N(5)-glutamine methyltransferase [Clostridiales Family XIII bacterium]
MSLEVKEILKIAEARLFEAGCDESKLHAEELLCFLMEFEKSKLFFRWNDVLSEKSCEAYFDLVDIRASRKPLQYITGVQEFMGIGFEVDERVLIPRFDTETLVTAVLDFMKNEKTPAGGWKALEIGTGSGAIAVSLCKNSDDVKVTATDISADAISAAKKNAASAGVSGRIKFIESDMFSAFKPGITGAKFNIIISNPPYIRSGDIEKLQPEIREHEPVLALDGGEDGLRAYRSISESAHLYLKKKGVIFLEIGYDQAEAVGSLPGITEHFTDVRIFKDLGECDRVFAARLQDKRKEK